MSHTNCRSLFDELLAFLNRLETAKIAYSLRRSREDALMVRINVPGERWEVEFLQDGDIEVERFVSAGDIQSASALDDLFARFSYKEVPEPEDASTGA